MTVGGLLGDRVSGLAGHDVVGGRGRPGGLLGRLIRRPELPWLAVAAVAVWVLRLAGDPVVDAVVYGGYWLIAIVVPGVLLQRVLQGSRSLVEDVGFGAVLGLAWQLVGWFVFTGLQLQVLLWAWPLGLVAVFALVPRLRRHLRVRGAEPVPLAWSWAAAASLALALLVLYWHWLRDTELPPRTRLFEADLWFHLSINAELTRTIFPEIPYIAGQPLTYHWFANVHMASGQMMTGIDSAAILLHIWLVPMVILLFLLTCGLSRWLSKRWWPALIAGTLTASLPVAVSVSSANVGVALTPIIHASPSSIYAGIVILALARSTLALLREGRSAAVWLSVWALTLLAAGTKPTVLPLCLAGTVFALIYLAVHRQALAAVVRVLLTLATGLVIGGLLVMGGAAGSELRLFGYFRGIKEFKTATGDNSVLGVTGGWAVPGVLDSGLLGWLLAAALVVSLVVYHLPSLLGVLHFSTRPKSSDVTVWWLIGVVLASYGPLLLIDHMGSSQKYFIVASFPIGMVLTCHAITNVAPRQLDFRSRWLLVGSFLVGALGAIASAVLFGQAHWRDIKVALVDLVTPTVLLVASLACLLLLRRLIATSGRNKVAALLLVAALVLGWSVPNALALTLGNARPDVSPTVATAGPVLAAAKQRAARWLATQGNIDDVIVTNAHCFQIVVRRGCDARSFWLSALAERRVFLEGWGYTSENATTRVRPDVDYRFQPSPWPQRLQRSNAAVSAPTPTLLRRLRQRHRVRWIFADKTVHMPAPALKGITALRYENRAVAVYELLSSN